MPLLNLVHEFLIYGLVVVCLIHAWRQRSGWIATFIGACSFAFIPEYLSVRTHSDYCYDLFLIMLPPWACATPVPGACPCPDAVPLWNILGWGFIFYLAMQTSSRLNLPWAVRPVLDAMLAVNFDWLLDPLAAGLHWWNWEHPGPWFGIPLDNYFGWMAMVGSYSFLLRWLRRRRFMTEHPRLRDLLAPFVAVPIAAVAAIGLIEGYLAIARWGVSQWLLLGTTTATMFATVLYFAIRVRGTQKPDWVLLGLAVFFQLYFVFLAWLTALYRAHPALILVALVTTAIAVLGFGWPYRFGARTAQAQ
jgi:uncharacterized membrane protein